MNGMEFSWRMVATLVWPLVVLAGLIVYRKWITHTLTSLTLKFGSVEVALNTKVDTTGQDIANAVMNPNMPQLAADAESASMVDLMPVVNKNIGEGIQAAFNRVTEVLKENYPKLGEVPPSQILQEMDKLANKGQLDKGVASSVTKLSELLGMREWSSDRAGDTRGYAFLMLAEGAIQGIIRSSEADSPASAGAVTSLARTMSCCHARQWLRQGGVGSSPLAVVLRSAIHLAAEGPSAGFPGRLTRGSGLRSPGSGGQHAAAGAPDHARRRRAAQLVLRGVVSRRG